MKDDAVIAIVMEEWERKSFFDQELWGRLNRMASRVLVKSSNDFDGADEWIKWLRSKQVEVLIGSWTTPRLPEWRAPIPDLKYVCYLAGSVKGLVADSLIDEGILVTNWGNSISRTVAECALMMAIASLRRVSFWTLEMHVRKGWKDKSNLQTGSLFGRRIGIHGFGAIARELVLLLRPFGVQISSYSEGVPVHHMEEYQVEPATSLEALFSENEVIFELEALTEENRLSVTERLLRSMPKGGVFVNIGRGALVDEDALARVAADGHILVALDVYSQEPLPTESPFRGIDDVLTLPHLGGPTMDRRPDSARLGLANVERYLAGQPLEGQITQEVYQRSS